jgi:hypothetical protein
MYKQIMVAVDRGYDVWVRKSVTADWTCLTSADKGSVGTDELIGELGPISLLTVASIVPSKEENT